ncbi:MAG: Uncharacterised protein [Candidatus Poseidoniaceae archaeon]|nr:MAG: Uncharacterised protein [Candidatus Poseidoniaceae archaeon]
MIGKQPFRNASFLEENPSKQEPDRRPNETMGDLVCFPCVPSKISGERILINFGAFIQKEGVRNKNEQVWKDAHQSGDPEFRTSICRTRTHQPV